jgi:hypothetical protein
MEIHLTIYDLYAYRSQCKRRVCKDFAGTEIKLYAVPRAYDVAVSGVMGLKPAGLIFT